MTDPDLTQVVSIRLSVEDLERLRAEATAAGVSFSRLVRSRLTPSSVSGWCDLCGAPIYGTDFRTRHEQAYDWHGQKRDQSFFAHEACWQQVGHETSRVSS